MKVTSYQKINNDIKKFDNKEITTNPYNYLMDNFVEGLTDILATVPLEYNEDGKVSATKTLKAVEDPELKAAVQIAYSSPRSKILGAKKATDKPKYASLTPLFMLAHKEKSGVLYEDWNKKDDMLVFVLGKSLYKLLDYPNPLPFPSIKEVAELRAEALNGHALSTYNLKAVEYKGVKFKHCDFATRMLLQTWLANVEYRVPHAMILDPWDWDGVPEPYDEKIPVEQKKVKEKKKKEVEWEIPWDTL